MPLDFALSYESVDGTVVEQFSPVALFVPPNNAALNFQSTLEKLFKIAVQ